MIRVQPAGDRAVLVEVRGTLAPSGVARAAAAAAARSPADDSDAVLDLLAGIRAASLEGVQELVPGARTVLVRFDPTAVSAAALRTALQELPPATERPLAPPTMTVPVRYDGEDLAAVADLLGLSVDALIARHHGAAWRVAFLGFAPGFAYLVGDDPVFDVPRRATPRTRIPAGAVALAGPYSGIYPTASPGGWQLIGSTEAVLFDLERQPPALLAAGAPVRFVPAAREPVHLSRAEHTGWSDVAQERPTGSAHALEVVQPGPQLLVQDQGRAGHGGQGVSTSGAADRAALREANRAVGNLPGEAGLELLHGPAVLRFHGPAVIALAGALSEALVIGGAPAGDPQPESEHPGLEQPARQRRQEVAHGRAVAIDDGDELHVGPVRDGLRVLLAIRGGIAIEPVLGSRSADTLGRLGPPPLVAGTRLPLRGPTAAPRAVEPTEAPRRPLPTAADVTTLDVVLGPRADWCTPDALRLLVEQEWQVSPRSDRIGVRLSGAQPLERAITSELPSEGALRGGIQVPPDGQPVLLLADHPATGGYPIVACVVDEHLDRAGQLPPGARVRFRIRDAQTHPEHEEAPWTAS